MGVSRPSAGHQQANSRPSPQTPARAVAVEGARAWVHPAADPVARRLRRARCRRRCTPPDEGRNQMHSVRPSATTQQAGSGVVHLPLSPSISLYLPLSPSISEWCTSLHLPPSPSISEWCTNLATMESQAHRGAIRSNQRCNQKQSPPPLLESQAHRGHDGGGQPRQYRRRNCTHARSSGRLSEFKRDRAGD